MEVAGIGDYFNMGILKMVFACSPCFCMLCAINAQARMRLRERLGIQPRQCEDILCTVFLPCCAQGQEALCVDQEVGVRIMWDSKACDVSVVKVDAPQQQAMREPVNVVIGSPVEQAVEGRPVSP